MHAIWCVRQPFSFIILILILSFFSWRCLCHTFRSGFVDITSKIPRYVCEKIYLSSNRSPLRSYNDKHSLRPRGWSICYIVYHSSEWKTLDDRWTVRANLPLCRHLKDFWLASARSIDIVTYLLAECVMLVHCLTCSWSPFFSVFWVIWSWYAVYLMLVDDYPSEVHYSFIECMLFGAFERVSFALHS